MTTDVLYSLQKKDSDYVIRVKKNGDKPREDETLIYIAPTFYLPQHRDPSQEEILFAMFRQISMLCMMDPGWVFPWAKFRHNIANKLLGENEADIAFLPLDKLVDCKNYCRYPVQEADREITTDKIRKHVDWFLDNNRYDILSDLVDALTFSDDLEFVKLIFEMIRKDKDKIDNWQFHYDRAMGNTVALKHLRSLTPEGH